MVKTIKNEVPDNSIILSMELGRKTKIDLEIFTGREISSLDPFTEVPGSYWIKDNYQKNGLHISRITGLTFPEFSALSRNELTTLLYRKANSAVRTSNHENNLITFYGSPGDYLLYRAPCAENTGTSHVFYKNDSFCLIKLPKR